MEQRGYRYHFEVGNASVFANHLDLTDLDLLLDSNARNLCQFGYTFLYYLFIVVRILSSFLIYSYGIVFTAYFECIYLRRITICNKFNKYVCSVNKTLFCEVNDEEIFSEGIFFPYP